MKRKIFSQETLDQGDDDLLDEDRLVRAPQMLGSTCRVGFVPSTTSRQKIAIERRKQPICALTACFD
jgi:hypothetical protein